MYSGIRSVTILIALLKKFGISQIVVSPGGSDIPIIHSLQIDSFFTCHSVVDERSAAYYAMGWAQCSHQPVACVCTSGTAVCNYLPGITEAFYQDVPVIAITADKNPQYQDQLEIQKIEQTKIFSGVVKKSVNLPVVHNEMDAWLCNRLVNEALLELNHHGTGPVHINIPIVGNQNSYNCLSLPDERKISIISCCDNDAIWAEKREELGIYQNILVIVGQNIHFTSRETEAMTRFFHSYNCIFAVENLSNLDCEGCVHTYPISEILHKQVLADLKPDLIISLGNNLSAYLLKEVLREHHKSMTNWLISEKGAVRDPYKSLRYIFECSPTFFFEKMTENTTSQNEDMRYYKAWSDVQLKMQIPAFPFSNMYVAQKLAAIIPENSILHTAILNSTRVMQHCKLARGVTCYSNVGALGIDGCFSTFAGQAAATNHLAYLLIGDLSFFYDMNAATIRSISNNVRIILLNNGGGAEFHVYDHNVDQIDEFICAEHTKRAGGFIQSLGFAYYEAHNEAEFDTIISRFAEPSDHPMFLECFMDMHDDAQLIKTYYDSVRNDFTSDKDRFIEKAKDIGRTILSEKQIKMVKNLLGR